jgi:hypothetical protein
MIVLLNGAVVAAGLVLAVILSTRHAHWGPEGAVGAWLLAVPYVLIAAAVTGALIVRGSSSWVPGGRITCVLIWSGLLIAFSVSGYYSMSDLDTTYEQFAALTGWLLLAGCLVAVNAAPSLVARSVIVATLGLGGVAGWLQVAAWLVDDSRESAQVEESKIANEQAFQDRMDAEFRALGKDAPLWNYFSYMYISNEELRKQCHEIIASRADRDERLTEYLGNEILASSATRYIGEFHPAPGPALAPAFAIRSDLVLSQIAAVNADSDRLSDRSSDDIRDILRAAVRIHKGGGDLTTQLEGWWRYLKRFANTAELVAVIDDTLRRSGKK